MSHPVPPNYTDLQTRLMQAVAAGIEDFSTALCIHDGTLPAGAARLHAYELVILNTFTTVLKKLGTDGATRMLRSLVAEAERAVADGTSVGVPRPTASS